MIEQQSIAADASAIDKEDALGQTLAGKYMIFRLGDEEYAIDILKVQELIALIDITRVPGAEGYVCGVMNLRGTVIPVVDLRLRMGFDAGEETRNTVIIVARFPVRDREVIIGSKVDQVVGVTDFAPEQIDEVPALSSASVNRDSIRGVAKIEGRVIFMLDASSALAPNAGGPAS